MFTCSQQSLAIRKGIGFENNVRYILKLSKYTVLDEKDIVSYYGSHCYGIDHIIKTHDTIYFFQDKWTNSKITLPQINHFSSAIKFIITQEHTFNKFIGIYISKNELTSRSKNALSALTTNDIYFETISSEDEKYVIKLLIDFLYTKYIFLFEEDGSCFMNCDELVTEIMW